MRAKRASIARSSGSAHVRRLVRDAEQAASEAAPSQGGAEKRSNEVHQHSHCTISRNNEENVFVLARDELQFLLGTSVFVFCHTLVSG